MKRKLSVLVIIIVIVAMSIAVIAVLAAQRSFVTVISDDLNTPEVPAQTVGANQQLKMFDGRPFTLNLPDEEDEMLDKLQDFEGFACTKKGVDNRVNPIENGVVQIEKEKGKGPLYSFRFKWDESTKLLESDDCNGVFTESWVGETLTVTIAFSGDFTLRALLGDEHLPSGRIRNCDWFTIWEGTLEFIVELTEQT